LLACALTLSACQPEAVSAADPASSVTPEATSMADSPTEIPVTATPSATMQAEEPAATPTTVDEPANARETPTNAPASPTPNSALVEIQALPAEDWKGWPVIPEVPRNVIDIYQRGLALGNDPHSFSILGDCQSLAETFLGVYDTDPRRVASLPDDLQAFVANFAGSFERQSPTIKGGTTAGAVLWSAWHENLYTCQANESPLDCELRLHKPSIIIINLGTHYETRNITYLRKILDQLIAQGIVPILATKADNRELDDRLNLEMAELAVEYQVPLWNFWAAVSDLPNNGVGIKEGDEHLGEIYLSEEGLERHRYSALQALSAVWEVVK
jgi:hypothetical protein